MLLGHNTNNFPKYPQDVLVTAFYDIVAVQGLGLHVLSYLFPFCYFTHFQHCEYKV